MKFFRKANTWEDMPKIKVFSWRGRQVLLVNWQGWVVTEGAGKTIAGMRLGLWWHVFSYLR